MIRVNTHMKNKIYARDGLEHETVAEGADALGVGEVRVDDEQGEDLGGAPVYTYRDVCMWMSVGCRDLEWNDPPLLLHAIHTYTIQHPTSNT